MRNKNRPASFDLQIVGGQNISSSKNREAFSARQEISSILTGANQRIPQPTLRYPRFFLNHKLPEATALSLLPDISTKLRKNREKFAVLGKPIVLKPDQETFIGTVAQVQCEKLDHQQGMASLTSVVPQIKDSVAGKPYSTSPVVTVRRRKVRSCPPASPAMSYVSKNELIVTSVQLINKPEKEKKNKIASNQFAFNEATVTADGSEGTAVACASNVEREVKASPKQPLSPLILISSASNRDCGASLKWNHSPTTDKDKQTPEASKMVEHLISASQKRAYLHDRGISRKTGKAGEEGERPLAQSENTDIRSLLKKYSPCEEMLTHKIIKFSAEQSNKNGNHRDKINSRQATNEDTSYLNKHKPDTKLKTIVLSFPGFDAQDENDDKNRGLAF